MQIYTCSSLNALTKKPLSQENVITVQLRWPQQKEKFVNKNKAI